MEKSFPLDSRESAACGQLDQQRTQCLAAVGALSLDMEQARKNLEATAERQRAFIQQLVAAKGIDRFENARVQNGALLVTVPEVFQLPSIEAPAARPNGAAAELE
jgi:hypothetical protein